MSLGDGGLNMPYEDIPDGPLPSEQLDLTHAHIAAGVVTMAASAEVGGKREPAILFRFGDGAGGFYPPMLLVVTVEEMEGLVQVVSDAARAAIAHARQGE